MTEMNSPQDILRRVGFVHDAAKGDHLFFGLAVGGQYNATNPTLTDGDWATLQVDASGRLKCILDGATINLGGDLDVDVSAFIDSSGANVDGAMVFTDGESLTGLSTLWQGIGGYDSVSDAFRTLELDAEGKVPVAKSYAIGDGIASNGALLSTPTGVNNDAPLVTFLMGYNGATWDRLHATGGVLEVSASSDVPTTLTSGVKTVASAGTAECIVASSTPCKSVIITALVGNTGVIYVGDSAVSSANPGTPIYAGGSVALDIDDLDNIYIDSSVNGEGVSFNYLNQENTKIRCLDVQRCFIMSNVIILNKIKQDTYAEVIAYE